MVGPWHGSMHKRNNLTNEGPTEVRGLPSRAVAALKDLLVNNVNVRRIYGIYLHQMNKCQSLFQVFHDENIIYDVGDI